MTWGTGNGDESNSWRYPDYVTMQHHLETGYLAYAENLSSEQRPVFIAPVGMAFENIFSPYLMLLMMELSSPTYTLQMGVTHPFKELFSRLRYSCIRYWRIVGRSTEYWRNKSI